MRKCICWIVFLLTVTTGAYAQSVSVTAKIDSTQIKIGQQTKIKLQVIAGKNQRVLFPVFHDTIVNNVLLVSVAQPDTQKIGDDRLQITKSYTVTSFDSALYYIPPMVVKVDNANYPSQALSLKVLTVPVDTVHADRFYGEKAVMNPPFVWSDWIGLILCSFFALVFIAGLVYLSIRLRDNKPIIRRIKVEPKLTPQQIAMKEIQVIKEERLSLKKDNPKEYYTRLTEAIRKYIKDRFNFNALEMTSQEIIDKLIQMNDKDALNDLKLLFQTADLVKFAKHAPELNENDANLVKAVDFINQTQKAEEIVAPQPTEITIVEKRSLRTKRMLVGGIVLLSLILLGCLVYVGMQLYELLG